MLMIIIERSLVRHQTWGRDSEGEMLEQACTRYSIPRVLQVGSKVAHIVHIEGCIYRKWYAATGTQ